MTGVCDNLINVGSGIEGQHAVECRELVGGSVIAQACLDVINQIRTTSMLLAHYIEEEGGHYSFA